MPASRSARAMIFAPRSCPSSPGLATTTRILRSAMWPSSLGPAAHLQRHRHVRRVDRADDLVGADALHLAAIAAGALERGLEAHRPALHDHIVLAAAGPVPLDPRALLDRHRRRVARADVEVVAHLDVARGAGGGRGQREAEDEGNRQWSQHQNTGVSVYVPKTAWRASTISPSLACTRAQANRFGIRLRCSSAAAVLSSASARSTGSLSRRPRTACTRPICLRSSAGSMRRISISASPPSRYPLTPTTI